MATWGGLAAYTILLDGEWGGKLMNEDQIVLKTNAGQHSLQFIDWCPKQYCIVLDRRRWIDHV